MTEFGTVRGFEDLWRPVARQRRVLDQRTLPRAGGGLTPGVKARLARIASRAPEVMVKITGRTRDKDHLQAHLKYTSRAGALPLEGRDGELLSDLRDVQELAADWAAEDWRKRATASMSLSIVLSMPPGTSIVGTRDAARAFAQEIFGERFDYVFALHTDAGHPHVHLAVRSLGADGVRLNPRKADLDHWRQTFARKLRARGVAAEATPRRARGVVRKAERMPVRKLRERHEEGRGPAPRVTHGALEDAAKIVAGRDVERPWEARIIERQQHVRRTYAAAASRLAQSASLEDRALGRDVQAFVAGMPPPVTRRNELVKAIRVLAERATGKRRKEPGLDSEPQEYGPGRPRR